MVLKGKTSRKWANRETIYDSEYKVDPRGSSVQGYPWAIYMYMAIIVKQILSQISGERLQDH